MIFDVWAAGCACSDCTWARVKAAGSSSMPMCVCPECGNKRCPKATNHANKCSGSNEPGQPGSRYA